MTQYTRPGYFGFPAGWNDSDFTGESTEPAAGQWTRLGYFGVAAGWNSASFVTEEPMRTVTATFDASFTFTFEPFNELAIQAQMPAKVAASVSNEFGRSNTEIDHIKSEVRSTYLHEVQWI